MFPDERRKLKGEAHRLGQRAMKDRIIHMFQQYAVSHPEPVVVDELWAFVEKLREVELSDEDR